jgi:hypothetical protein
MRVDFFEEFAATENLRKADMVTWPSLVYLAAHSLHEFDRASAMLHEINPSIEAGYWPVLKESYWISPFSSPHELKTLAQELAERKSNLKVLLDLELPLLKPSLFFMNLFSFCRNRRIIREILLLSRGHYLQFSTAEYPFVAGAGWWVLRTLGVSYKPQEYGHQRIVMFYSSMIRRLFLPLGIDARNWFKRSLRKQFRRGQSAAIGLGTIAIGILGNEPILPPQDLENDLAFCREIGAKRIVIFRLGGLTAAYVQPIARCAD